MRARFCDHAGSVVRLRIARAVVLPSVNRTTSAPGLKSLSRLNGWPARTPVNASPSTSRCTAHDSGPVWFAMPSLQGTCTLYSLPVSRRTRCRFEPHIDRRLNHGKRAARGVRLEIRCVPNGSPQTRRMVQIRVEPTVRSPVHHQWLGIFSGSQHILFSATEFSVRLLFGFGLN